MAKVWDEMMRQRLTRRRLLGSAAGVGAGVAGLALVGCGDGGGGGNGNGTGSDTPTKGGILRLRQTNSFPSLAPTGVTALASTLVFGFWTYDHLWYVPIDTGENELQLASNLEIVDPEGMQVNATLHEAFFHNKAPVNGRQVTSNDVKVSWELFRDDPAGLGRVWLQEIMESLETPSDLELIIRQKRPWAWMFGTAGAGSPASSSVLPAETLGEDSAVDLDTDVLGSGRFFLESHDGGANVKLRAFDNWRVADEPYLGGIDLLLISDYVSAEAQFIDGAIDQIAFQNKTQQDDVKGRLGDDIITTEDLSRSYNQLMMMAKPPFDNPAVVRAFRLGIDRDEMIQLVELDAAGGRKACIVPPAQTLYALPDDDPDVVEYWRYDPEEAQSLLEEANFPFDDEIELLISSPNEELANRAQVLKAQFERIGVNVRIDAQDLLSNWVPRVLVNSDYQMTLFTHLAYEDPYIPTSWYTTFAPIGLREEDGRRNGMAYYDQEISDAVDATALELDLEPRANAVKDVQRLIMEKEPPAINMYSGVSFGARWHWYKDLVEGRGSFGLFNGRAWIDSSLRDS
jgi:peptide/nickel transport system substrate-binding protein